VAVVASLAAGAAASVVEVEAAPSSIGIASGDDLKVE
jgi:hypothetical protein